MADEPQIGQDEIEALLKQAQSESAGAAATPTEPREAAAETGQPPAAAQATAATATVAKNGVNDDDIAEADMDLLLRQAEAAIASVNEPTAPTQQAQQFRLKDFAGASPSNERSTLELIRDVELDLKIELGRTHMALEEVLKLRKGSVVPLEKLAGDPVDIFVNGRLIARGEVLVLNDNFCVRVAELIASEAVA